MTKKQSSQKSCVFNAQLIGKVASVSYKESHDFNQHPLNRRVNQSHVNEIKRGMTSVEELQKFSPIEVNVVTGNIIDGQHRLAAFQSAIEDETLPKGAKLLVYFLRATEDEEIQLIQDKQNSKSWTMYDLVEKHAKERKPMFREMLDFAANHELTHKGSELKPAYALSVITGNPQYPNLRKGTIKITKEQLKNADKVHDELKDILVAFGLTTFGRHINSLAQSWHRHRDKINTADIKDLMTRKRDTTYRDILLKMERQNTRQWDAIFEAAETYINIIKARAKQSAKKRAATRLANK